MLLVIDIGNTNTSLGVFEGETLAAHWRDRKSTRLNSSHSQISYAVFCLKKKKKNTAYYIQLTKTTYSTSIHRSRASRTSRHNPNPYISPSYATYVSTYDTAAAAVTAHNL